MTRRLTVPLVVVGLGAAGAAFAGCGGSSGGADTAGAATPPTTANAAHQGQVLRLQADPSGALRFDVSKLTAKPGTVTLRMTNPSSAGMDHGIAVDGNGVDQDGPIVSPGSVSTVTATLKKGTYTYYCPVPGHRQAGMTGTLTVR